MWTDGLDAEALKFVTDKGFKAPAEALTALRELQAPSTPEDYKLEVPQGADPEFAKAAASWFHKHHVPAQAAEGFVKEFNAYAKTEMERMAADDAAAKAASDAAAVREKTELQNEWGSTTAAQFELARRATATYAPGDTPELKAKLVETLQREVGYKATMQMFAKIGAHLAEHQLHGLGGQGGGQSADAAVKFFPASKMNP